MTNWFFVMLISLSWIRLSTLSHQFHCPGNLRHMNYNVNVDRDLMDISDDYNLVTRKRKNGTDAEPVKKLKLELLRASDLELKDSTFETLTQPSSSFCDDYYMVQLN